MAEIRYIRLNCDGLIQKTKELTGRLFGRLMEETDFDNVETRDLELLKDSMALFNESLRETEKFQEQLNYQTELMEEAIREIRDVKARMEKLEKK